MLNARAHHGRTATRQAGTLHCSRSRRSPKELEWKRYAPTEPFHFRWMPAHRSSTSPIRIDPSEQRILTKLATSPLLVHLPPPGDAADLEFALCRFCTLVTLVLHPRHLTLPSCCASFMSLWLLAHSDVLQSSSYRACLHDTYTPSDLQFRTRRVLLDFTTLHVLIGSAAMHDTRMERLHLSIDLVSTWSVITASVAHPALRPCQCSCSVDSTVYEH